jgi:alkane 1-monooxygenase
MRSILPYLAALGASVALLVAGAVLDGPWGYASLVWMALVVAGIDQLLPGVDDGPARAWAERMTTAMGVLHFPLLALAVWVLATSDASWPGWIAYLLAAALFFGQIVNANAHELIHARGRLRRALGRWAYVTLLFGHQATAHPGLHHVHVATPEDPNTSRLNEAWWRFCFRAWHHSFWKGLALEKRRQRAAGRYPWGWRNPYWQYVGGAVACMAAVHAATPPGGLTAYLLLCWLAQSQLLMTDYVLHYGMRRARVGDRWEPVGPRHSWNTPHVASALLTVHSGRHSDHHAHPARGFEALRIERGQPQLPWSLPVMVTLALWPWFWRRYMNPRVAALEAAEEVPMHDRGHGPSPMAAE